MTELLWGCLVGGGLVLLGMMVSIIGTYLSDKANNKKS